MTTKMYGYRRVSKVGERGDELISPELQTHAIDTWATPNGIEIVEWFEDLDETGRKFEKRKVKKMIEGIENGEAQGVVLWKWSRWGRNLLQSKIYIAAVEAAGGQVRAATEDFDPTTTMGKFTRDQMLMIAELQSNQISDGWKETQARRRRNGLPHTSLPRYGYAYDRESKAYVVDEDLRHMVGDLYLKAVGGRALYSLALELNEKGILTLNGSLWTTTSLGRMLDTGFAAGLIRERSKAPTAEEAGSMKKLRDFDVWRKGAHEAIIDEELWDAYKKMRLVAASKPKRTAGKGGHALTNRMVCAECGSPMYSVYSGRYGKHTWTCGARQRAMTTGVSIHVPVSCSNKRILEVVEKWIDDHARGLDLMGVEVERAAPPGLSIPTNLESLQARVDGILEQQVTLSRQLMKKRIKEHAFDELNAELEAELEEAEAALAIGKAVPKQTDPPTRAEWKGLQAAWGQATEEVRRRLLETVVSSVVVKSGPWGEGKLMIVPGWLAR